MDWSHRATEGQETDNHGDGIDLMTINKLKRPTKQKVARFHPSSGAKADEGWSETDSSWRNPRRSSSFRREDILGIKLLRRDRIKLNIFLHDL